MFVSETPGVMLVQLCPITNGARGFPHKDSKNISLIEQIRLWDKIKGAVLTQGPENISCLLISPYL